MKFSKIAVGTLLLSGLLAAAGPVFAQTNISLDAASEAVVFKGLGKSNTTQEDIFLGQCVKGTCTEIGSASGSGLVASGPARYSFTSPVGSIVATLVNATMGDWTVSQTAPILFNYGGTKAPLLTGDLSLVSFQEVPNVKPLQGEFNYQGVANLKITGGSLEQVLGAEGILELTVVYTFKNYVSTTKNVMSLLGTTNSISGRLAGGELLPTPEPSAFAIFLLGMGMLLVGSLLRLRKHVSTAAN